MSNYVECNTKVNIEDVGRVPANADIPTEEEISFESLIEGMYLEEGDLTQDDEDYIEDVTIDFLSDKYGFCIYGVGDMEINWEERKVEVSDIEWDFDDEEDEED